MTINQEDQTLPNHLPDLLQGRFFDTIAQIKLINHWRDTRDMSYDEYNELMTANAKEFVEVMYENKLMVDFNWVDWTEGEPLIYKGEFEQFDNLTLLKMLTFIVKYDNRMLQFLVTKFEDNTILEIITILERRINTFLKNTYITN